MKKLNVVLVGLGFGGAFVPIYKDHPAVGNIGILIHGYRADGGIRPDAMAHSKAVSQL